MSRTKIKLMPPVLLGRYFQALAIYLSDMEIKEYGPDYIVVDSTELESVFKFLLDDIEDHLRRVGIQPPTYGNDKKYFFKKVLGEEIYNSIEERERRLSEKKGKDAYRERIEIWIEKWKEIILRLSQMKITKKNKKKSLSRIQILKASIHESAKTFIGSKKIDELSYVTDPKGEALAIAGAILSLIGRVGDNYIMVLPPLPESLRENKEFVNSLKARYDALKLANLNYPFEKVPCSSEVFLQLIFANEIKDRIKESLECPNPTDNLFFALVSTGGNRPMVNSIVPLMASEILCKVGIKGDLLKALLNQVRADPNVAGACLNDVFQYVISNNPEFLYRCARRYADLMVSKEEKERRAAMKVLNEIRRVIR